MNILRKPFKYSFFNAALFLIGINVAVFFLQNISSITGYLAMNPLLVLNGWVWQFVTYMFAHQGMSHLLFNMLALFVFGFELERYLGSKEFLLYYLLTGTLAGIFSFVVYVLTGAFYVHLLGASGAIFAIQLAYACIFPDSVLRIWGIIPMRAPVLVLVFTALEIFYSVFGIQNGVAHLTHLAGVGFGALYFVVRWRANPIKLMLGKR
ncbi:MAG: rhomboid family intramembrane serine protease [Termitinemataceae bacterium]|nr:MAG: rhomboid family intramembrane serine protease [Termitinemataceae bacterium]